MEEEDKSKSEISDDEKKKLDQLYDDLVEGKEEAIDMLEKGEIDINSRWNGTTFVFRAIAERNFDLVELLMLIDKFDVNKPGLNNEEKIPNLVIACSNHVAPVDMKIVKELLKDPEIDVNRGSRGPSGVIPPIASAIRSNSYETVVELLKHPKIDINIAITGERNTFSTPLSFSLMGKTDPRIVNEILKHPNLDVNILSRLPFHEVRSVSPLYISLMTGKPVFHELVKRPGIDPNIGELLPLVFCCKFGKVEEIKKILEFTNVDIQKKETDGSDALGVTKNEGILKILEKHKPSKQ